MHGYRAMIDSTERRQPFTTIGDNMFSIFDLLAYNAWAVFEALAGVIGA